MKCIGDINYCKKQGQCDHCIILEYGKRCKTQEWLTTQALQLWIIHVNTCHTCINNTNIINEIKKNKSWENSQSKQEKQQ